MQTICVTLGDGTMAMLSEISDELEKLDGHKPSRSHIIRLAVAAMRKRVVGSQDKVTE